MSAHRPRIQGDVGVIDIPVSAKLTESKIFQTVYEVVHNKNDYQELDDNKILEKIPKIEDMRKNFKIV